MKEDGVDSKKARPNPRDFGETIVGKGMKILVQKSDSCFFRYFVTWNDKPGAAASSGTEETLEEE